MSVISTVISDIVKGDKFGVDDQGRTTCTRNFIVKLEPVGNATLSYSTKMSAILNSGIPTSNSRLFTDGVPAGCTNPYVNSIEVTPERDDDPFTYCVAVSYGYKDNEQSSQDDDKGDEPDVDRERYPWEQNAEVELNFGNSKEVVPELAEYAGCLKLNEVIAEKGTGSALTSSTVTQPLKNTAGDGFKDPPTKSIRSGQIQISFNVLTEDTYWNADDFNESMFKVNLTDTNLIIDGASLFTIPAGCAQLVGFSSNSQTYTESKKWRPGKEHPFGKTVNGRVLKNTTKSELTAYRYWTYKKISITLEFREDGFVQYIENLGFRERKYVYSFRNLSNMTYSVETIKEPNTKQDVTEPIRLNDAGEAIWDEDMQNVYFQKYRYYKTSLFSFLNNIPWQYQGTTS